MNNQFSSFSLHTSGLISFKYGCHAWMMSSNCGWTELLYTFKTTTHSTHWWIFLSCLILLLHSWISNIAYSILNDGQLFRVPPCPWKFMQNLRSWKRHRKVVEIYVMENCKWPTAVIELLVDYGPIMFRNGANTAKAAVNGIHCIYVYICEVLDE